MVRIINQPQDKKPVAQPAVTSRMLPALSQKHETLFLILGIVIAEQPERINELFESFGVEQYGISDDKQTAELLISCIGENDPDFNHELANLILHCGMSSQYDGLELANLVSSHDSFSGQGQGLVGSIAEAIGNVATSISQTRQARENATSNTLQGIYNYKGQLAAAQASKNKSRQILVICICILAGIALITALSTLTKSKPKITPTST